MCDLTLLVPTSCDHLCVGSVVLVTRVDLPEGGFTLRSQALALTRWEMDWVLDCWHGIEFSRAGVKDDDATPVGAVPRA
jgi:hypothetical protein